MGTFQVIFVVLLCLGLAVITAWNVVKIVYAIKTKGETLKPKGEELSEKNQGGKEE